MRRGGHELAHQKAVARARLVHEHRRRRARAVEVQHDADAVGPRVLAQEGARAEQAALLSVGEQEDDVVARPRPRRQRAGRLEQRDDPAAVVGGAGGHGHRVVVGHEQDRARRVPARQTGDHVADGAGHAAALRRDRGRGLHVRRQVERRRAGRRWCLALAPRRPSPWAAGRRRLRARAGGRGPPRSCSAALRSGAGGDTPSGVTPTTTSAATTATTSPASRCFLATTISE